MPYKRIENRAAKSNGKGKKGKTVVRMASYAKSLDKPMRASKKSKVKRKAIRRKTAKGA